MKRMTKGITDAAAYGLRRAEFVLPGHPDKLCDAVADAFVDCFRHDDDAAQCGIEVACVFDRVFVTGRIATSAGRAGMRFGGVCNDLVRNAYASAGYGRRCGRTCVGAATRGPQDRTRGMRRQFRGERARTAASLR